MPSTARRDARNRQTKVSADRRQQGLLLGVEGIEAHDLGRALLRSAVTPPNVYLGVPAKHSFRPDFTMLLALAEAAGGRPHVRGGRSASESLMLIAVQVHRYETAFQFLEAGRTVVEQRGVYATAIEDAVGRHPTDPEAAYAAATRFVSTVAAWRPLPGKVVMSVDDPEAIAARLRRTDVEWVGDPTTLAAKGALYERFAADDPERFAVFDRRTVDDAAAMEAMLRWLEQTLPSPPHRRHDV